MAVPLAPRRQRISASAAWESPPRGRRVRLDLLVTGTHTASGLPFKVLLEVKNTNWDVIAQHRVRPNLGVHRRQIWRYLDPLTEELEEGRLAWLQPAVVYGRRPADARRRELIESVFADHLISVLWYDDLGLLEDAPTRSSRV